MKVEASVAIAATCALLLLRETRVSTCRGSRLSTLRQALGFCIPRLVSLDALGVVATALALVLRTQIVMHIAVLRSAHARLLVENKLGALAAAVVDGFLWSLPLAAVSALITTLSNLVGQRFRKNLQEQMHSRLLPETAVASTVLAHKNPEHAMTQDTMLVASYAVDLFVSVVGPVVDIVGLSLRIRQSSSMTPPALITAYYCVASAVMELVLPDVAALQSAVQEREGDFRRVHTQIVAHAEEVAFFRGEHIERDHCNRALDSLMRRVTQLRTARALSDLVESVLAKYGGTALGYAVCAVPLLKRFGSAPASALAADYVLQQQLYVPLAQAVGKLVRLRSRVSLLTSSSERCCALLKPSPCPLTTSGNVVSPARCNYIRFDGVSIATPTGAPILTKLSFTVRPGDHLLIVGGTGCGKTSLVRTLMGLYAPVCGTVYRPSDEMALMAAPQRVFLPPVVLRDLLSYPSVCPDRIEDIKRVVELVGLGCLVERLGGDLDAIRPWEVALSGGERQRVGIARLLLNRPTFAVIDEATSALNQDDEVDVLQRLQHEGVTLITISQRPSLERMHSHVLYLEEHRATTQASS